MISSLVPLGVALLGGAATVLAQTVPPSCALDKKCPESLPCCGQYGQCGVGAFCLGGCDPRMSFSLGSCVPAPVCQDKTYKMDSLDRIQYIDEYLGDPSKADWVGQGEAALMDGHVVLTMPPRSVGTVLATTTYMWYGNVKARLKTSRGAGVVSAFILFSDVKDEIDFEWVGTELDNVQTNYYFQGIPNYVNGGKSNISNTYDDFRDYEIRWTPEQIEWVVDGVSVRTKKKSETWNATAQQWDFPQTPSRVQISLWPGGLETNAKGTVDWAGGPIKWDSDEIKKYGYYFAMFDEVKVECYKTNTAPGTNKKKSYYYNDIRSTNDTVVDSDKSTILKSFAGTGIDMDAGGTADGAVSIPGGSNNPGIVPGASNAGTGSSASNGDGSGSGTTSSNGCQTTKFCAGNPGGSGNSGGVRVAERTLGASALAIIIGFVGLALL